MRNYFRQIFLSFDHNTLLVLKDSFASTLVKVAGMVIGVVISIFLGRTIGADGLGIINLANRIGTVVLIVCLLGIKQVIIKEVAIAYSQQLWHRIRDVMQSSYIINVTVTSFVTIVLLLLTPFLSKHVFQEPKLEIPLMIVVVALVPQVLSRIFSSGLIGVHKIWQSNLVDQGISQVIIGLILLSLWISDVEITVVNVALSYAAGRMIVAILIGFYWNFVLQEKNTNPRKFVGKEMLQTSLPLLFVGASSIIAANADVIMIGWLSSSTDVGIYTVASKIALLTSFFLQVTNSAASPKIASLFSKGEIKDMEVMIQRITTLLFVIAIIPLAVFFFFGKNILSIWGPEFEHAFWILIIISVGQFFNLSTGAAGITLILCGKEKTQGIISVSFLFLNLILNYFMILNYGALGAAIATAFTVAGENITKVICVKTQLGILTTPRIFKF